MSKAARIAALPQALQRELAAARALVAHTHLTHAEWLAVVDRYEEAQVSGDCDAYLPVSEFELHMDLSWLSCSASSKLAAVRTCPCSSLSR
jgi:hypothetical protein